MNIILVLIFIYLIFKYKCLKIKKEELVIYPSDISILIYDKIPSKIKKAELLFLPKVYINLFKVMQLKIMTN